jgi:hypothetical protein
MEEVGGRRGEEVTRVKEVILVIWVIDVIWVKGRVKQEDFSKYGKPMTYLTCLTYLTYLPV